MYKTESNGINESLLLFGRRKASMRYNIADAKL